MLSTRPFFTGAAPALSDTPSTVGALSTITDDTKYNAWPVICRLRNGDLLLGYTKGDTHHADNTGKGVVRRSTDDGTTWGAEVTVYDDPSLWTSLFGLAITPTGRVIATLWRDDGTTADDEGQAGLSYSDDNGVTWSTWIDVPNSFTGGAYGTGPVLVCGNGDELLYNVEGRMADEDPLDRYSHTVRSFDDGLTWSGENVVHDFDVRPYYESKLLRLRDGTIIILHRTSAGTGTCYAQRSTDDGYTWGAAYSVFDGYGAPSNCRLRGDGLVAVTRRNSDQAAIAYTSDDGGLTWSSEILLEATTMEYGAPIEKMNGTVLVVWGKQPTGDITNSDIRSTVLS